MKRPHLPALAVEQKVPFVILRATRLGYDGPDQPSRSTAATAGIERAVRDARLGAIGGGTDEIMKEIQERKTGL